MTAHAAAPVSPGDLHESLYAPIVQELRAVEQVFDQEIASRLPFVASLCEAVRSYRGKMLRPALVLLTGDACGGLVPGHRTVAAVIEMVHMATLVHDDVLDEADERRRRPTVRRLAGNTAAVLLGDYLISHAFHLCSSLESQYASRRVGATTNTVCEGELLQNFHAGNLDLSEEEYFAIIRGKTAVLTAVSCELGAHFAGANPEVVAAMSQFGMNAGMAFQIVDDVLDIAGLGKQVGKTLGQDAALGKTTLPVIHALRDADASVRDLVRAATRGRTPAVAGDVAADGCLAPHSDRALAAVLCAAGSLDYAMTVARGYVEDACRLLQLLPPSDARASLAAMAEFIVQRQF